MNIQALITECIKNKRSAQQQLYNAYADTMLTVCYRYTRNIHDAEDVLQIGFVKVFKNIAQFNNQGELGAWIRRIMVNSSLDYIKKHSRYNKELVFEEINLHQVSTDNPDIKLLAQDIIELIRELPFGYQTIFNLIGVEGYSHAEAAQMLNISEQTSRSQYSRARASLIKQIQQRSSKPENFKNYV